MASPNLFYRSLRNVVYNNLKRNESVLCLRSKKLSRPSVYEYSSVPKTQKGSSLKLLTATSIALGIGAGGVYSYFKTQDKSVILNKEVSSSEILKSLPDVSISRKVEVPGHSTGLKLILFQYPTCPFCCKVRAFLDFYGISYDIVEVNPVLRQQLKWSKYKKVPILLVEVDGGYQQLNDSTMIVSALQTLIEDRSASLSDIVNYYPTISYRDDDGKVKKEIMNKYFVMYQKDMPEESLKKMADEERRWRKWVDEVLVHTLSPNVYRSKEEALQAFNWFSEAGEWEKHFSAWERHLVIYVGAFAMWIIGKRLKNRHNLKDDVRQSLYDECKVWTKNIKLKGTKFIGGNVPNLGDLAVYGVLNSIEGCNAFQDLMQNSSSIEQWYQDMKWAVNNHIGMNVIGTTLSKQ